MEVNWSVVVTLLLALALFAAGGCGFFFGCRWVKRAQSVRRRTEDRHLGVLCGSLRELGDRVIVIEADLRRLMERQDQVEMRAPTTEYFKHAIALVRRGASLEDLISACGLAKGEAELLHLLHHADGSAGNGLKAHTAE